MAARFAGSRSLDERRRRRLAAEEKPPSAEPDGTELASERELPTRRPTGRFPLRRLIPSSRWKLTAIALAVVAVAELAALAGQLLPGAHTGDWGPGLQNFFAAEESRLAICVAGMLLLASAQFAWLIRWARARSLRDFGGGYRVWLWVSVAFAATGVAILSDAHLAFAATVTWAFDRQLFGSDAAYQILPAIAALVFLVPSLQRDMRGCITSRTLMLVAVSLLVLGSATVAAAESLQSAVTSWEIELPVSAATRSLLMTGVATIFASLLFHARHVVYESVEPPERKSRKPKALPQTAELSNPTGEDSKTSPRKSRRSSRSSKQAAVTEESPTASARSTSTKTVVEEPRAKEPAVSVEVATSAAEPEARVTKPTPVIKPAPVAPPVAPCDEVDESDDDADAGGHASFQGRQIRLDGPEDDLRGLSKRERRKLRKAAKDRERMEI